MKYRIIGKSEQIEAILKLIKDIANSNVTVLINGEKGTGKELIARNLHYNSENHKKRFVALHCASISSKLIESVILGYNCMVYLSEIGELEPLLQVKLLRVLKEKEFELSERNYKDNFRLISSTSHDIEKEIKSGNFREDLFYMLNVVQLNIPPLRSRKVDIPLLVEDFMNTFCLRENKTLKVSDEVMKIFMNYSWQGNVKELKNVIERAVTIAKGPLITPRELPIYIFSAKPLPLEITTEDVATQGALSAVAKKALKIAEKERIVEVLRETEGNKAKAAKKLRVCYKTLYTKIKEYGIESILE